MTLKPIEIKEKFEKENPDWIVIHIAKYHGMYIVLAPRRENADDYIESTIYILNKHTGKVIGNPPYTYDLIGFQKALDENKALYVNAEYSGSFDKSKYKP